ncbi:MAG: 1,4-alpha-glucan branching enzyme, partial [Dermatophilus congolensis]|nr:1,4-alpha-glucan branching enzyme [Dermatophilus congolensis]
MAEIFNTTLNPTKLELLTGWIARQRWYVGTGTPQLRRVGGYRLDDPADEVGIEIIVVADDSPLARGAGGADDGPVEPVVYQVPLTYRGAELAGAQNALVGNLEHGILGKRWVYDAPHDPVFAAALYDMATGATRPQHATVSFTLEPRVVAVHSADATDGVATRVGVSRVLSGEQSNTSIILDLVDPDGADAGQVIAKVFRTLSPGENPDVVLTGAIWRTGASESGQEPPVPRLVADVAGAWDDPTTGIEVRGHLLIVQEFLAGTRDAWRTALEAATAGVDFTERARDLGRATARVHRILAYSFETPAAGETERAELARQWRGRAAEALASAPELGDSNDLADDIDAVFTKAEQADWPPLQRVHGDLHLGQVLDVPGRGWVLLDFEGEPLRPLSERVLPDLPQRDVAGMIRSFDYVAGTVAALPQGPGAEAARAWADAATDAFLAGYRDENAQGGHGTGVDDPLLSAFVLDKALYEVSYETRNRPDWAHLPISAVRSLLGSSTASTTQSNERSTITVTSTPAGPLPVSPHTLDLLVRGGHGDPHSVLGAHPYEGGFTIRALRPMASSVTVKLADGTTHEMDHDYEGVWVKHIDQPELSDYRLIVDYGDGFEHEQDDPYRFWPTLGEVDLHLIGEGRHEELWKVLGSHIRTYDGTMGPVEGTSFAVWAPNARAIRVAGDFNNWDGQAYPMRCLGSTGVWELFIPGVGENSTYKYDILGADGYWRTKADPMARATECPPATASVVTQSHYEWNDAEWMAERASFAEPHNRPMSVYECHFGSWREGLSYVEAAEHLVNYVKDLGYTHVEFLPLAEHPYGPSWGYQVTGYFAPTSRFGSPDELRYLIDVLHQNGIGVIMDWVPAHFPKDGFALGRFDGQPLYEHPDPRRGEHKDWGTYIFDFGRPQVRNFLVANACFWIEEFHIDGLRVDAVASMLYLDYSREDGEWYPNEYGGRENLQAVQLLQETNATLYRRYPGVITAAEESTSWGGVTKPTYMGGLGFGLKWNMGWMHDTLGYAELSPIYRQYHHHQMTFAMVYQYSENFILPI